MKGGLLVCTCPPLAAVRAGVARDVGVVVAQTHRIEADRRAIAVVARVDVAASEEGWVGGSAGVRKTAHRARDYSHRNLGRSLYSSRNLRAIVIEENIAGVDDWESKVESKCEQNRVKSCN